MDTYNNISKHKTYAQNAQTFYFIEKDAHHRRRFIASLKSICLLFPRKSNCLQNGFDDEISINWINMR